MTLDEIKTQWAKDHSYENYFEFLDLTRKCDTDHVFIMDGAVTQIAKRYAKSKTQELIEQNRELVSVMEEVQIELLNLENPAIPDTQLCIKITELLTKYQKP